MAYLLGRFIRFDGDPGIGVLGDTEGSVWVEPLPAVMAGRRWDQSYAKPNYVTTRAVTFFVNQLNPPRFPGKPEIFQEYRSLPMADGMRQYVELDPHLFQDDDGNQLPALFMTYDFVTKSWWVDETSPGWTFPGEGWKPFEPPRP